MLKLKSDLFCDGNIAKLIREATKAYTGSVCPPGQKITCPNCKKEVLVQDVGDITVSYAPQQWHPHSARHITVHKAPVMKCPACGYVADLLQPDAAISDALHDWAASRNMEYPPAELDFEDLLQDDEASLVTSLAGLK